MSVKLSKYIASGVREYWMLDIEKRRLIIYELVDQADVRVLPLQGEAGLSIYGGKLKINLDQIAALIDQAPENDV
jgi:Uma2 family endonuclease